MFVNQIFDTVNHVAILKLNRPDRSNSLTPEMIEEICVALEELKSRSDLYSVIISGEGKAFAQVPIWLRGSKINRSRPD